MMKIKKWSQLMNFSNRIAGFKLITEFADNRKIHYLRLVDNVIKNVKKVTTAQ